MAGSDPLCSLTELSEDATRCLETVSDLEQHSVSLPALCDPEIVGPSRLVKF